MEKEAGRRKGGGKKKKKRNEEVESEKRGAIEGVQRCERSFSMAECFKFQSGRASPRKINRTRPQSARKEERDKETIKRTRGRF